MSKLDYSKFRYDNLIHENIDSDLKNYQSNKELTPQQMIERKISFYNKQLKKYPKWKNGKKLRDQWRQRLKEITGSKGWMVLI